MFLPFAFTLTTIEWISGATALAALLGTVVPHLIARWTARDGKKIDEKLVLMQLQAGHESRMIDAIMMLSDKMGSWIETLVKSHRDFMERTDRQREEIVELQKNLANSESRDERCQSALAELKEELAVTRNDLQAAMGRIEWLEGKG